MSCAMSPSDEAASRGRVRARRTRGKRCTTIEMCDAGITASHAPRAASRGCRYSVRRMHRERVIVSIGEALLAEHRGNIELGGLALNYAQAAAKSGFRGAAVSRIGQDESGEQLLRLAREHGI